MENDVEQTTRPWKYQTKIGSIADLTPHRFHATGPASPDNGAACLCLFAQRPRIKVFRPDPLGQPFVERPPRDQSLAATRRLSTLPHTHTRHSPLCLAKTRLFGVRGFLLKWRMRERGMIDFQSTRRRNRTSALTRGSLARRRWVRGKRRIRSPLESDVHSVDHGFPGAFRRSPTRPTSRRRG